MSTRLEILCKLHDQQGGTIHQFNQQYDTDILDMSDYSFKELLLDIFLKREKQNIIDYFSHNLSETQNHIYFDEDTQEYTTIDVRLGIDLDNFQWSVMYGSPDYDQRHYEFCSAATITHYSTSDELVDDLMRGF